MSPLLLDQPDTQTLLADAVLTPEAARGCQDRLTAFLRRYPPRFYHAEQRANAALVIRGLLTRRSTTWSDTAPGGGTAGRGRWCEIPFCRADTWAVRQPETRWGRLTIQDGWRAGPIAGRCDGGAPPKPSRSDGLARRRGFYY